MSKSFQNAIRADQPHFSLEINCNRLTAGHNANNRLLQSVTSKFESLEASSRQNEFEINH